MISGVLVINHKGDIVISRLYRDDVTISHAHTFRMKVIAAKETGTKDPVLSIGGTSFLYIRVGNIFVVALTRTNANAALVFQFLMALVEIFKGYFGEDFDEDAIRNNFTLVYELLDEILDFGYPQNTSLEVLQQYINLGAQKKLKNVSEMKKMSTLITGALDWRTDGLRYSKNEVFIDVLESVNLLLSATGTVLRSDVTGKVMMKTVLSGMPECKFGLNDKLLMDRDGAGRRRGHAVELEDCTFHRCVRLRTFDSDRTITFVPPDGEFELMRYRITENINLPFRILPVIEEVSGTQTLINIKVIASFSAKLFASNVLISVPTPPNTARCKLHVGSGRAKYEPEQQAVVWKIRRLPGGTELTLRGDIEMIKATKSKPWSRPPIQVEFQVPMFTASGLHVRSLKVFEKAQYSTTKWVRYITKGGQYQIRM